MIVTTSCCSARSCCCCAAGACRSGRVTLIFTGYGLLVNIMTEYRDIVLIVPLIIAGLAIDLMQRQFGGQREDGRLTLGGIRAIGPAAALILWVSYYAVLALDKGIGWDADAVGRRADHRHDDRLRRRLPGRAAVLRPAPGQRNRFRITGPAVCGVAAANSSTTAISPHWSPSLKVLREERDDVVDVLET